jgi:hypothetical protein
MTRANGMTMVLLCTIATSGACIDVADEDEPAIASEEQAASSYQPMGFARATGAGGLVSSFNSSGGVVTVTRADVGSYRVNFQALGTWNLGDSSLGNVQIVAEGTSNVRCQFKGTSGTTDLTVTVHLDCHSPDSSLADSAFAVLYYRYVMPPPNSQSANHAYTLVDDTGIIPSPRFDYNSSGVHNSVTKTSVGRYTVNIPNALAINASVMVTPAEFDQPGNVCSVASWSAGVIAVECRNPLGSLEDTTFTLSYSVSGPTIDQQGAHAWFNGTSASPTYSAALGKVSYCSPASVTGTRSGSLATMTVFGDLGSWDAGPFVRASFVSKYGTAGYCKVESLSSSGTAPSSTGTTTVRCYSATGAVIATPVFTFTHATNNASGPC